MNTTDVAEEPLTTAELLRDLVVTGPVLRDRHFPPVQWAVPGILPEGYSLLVGSSKVGKSWLCLSFLHAVAEGGKALARIVHETWV